MNTTPKQWDKGHISPERLRKKAAQGTHMTLAPRALREVADYIEWLQQFAPQPLAPSEQEGKQ